MRTAQRLGLAVAALLLARSDAPAQLPVAPHPHSTLDDLVAEYRRLGLPEPPANTELVRWKWKYVDDEGFTVESAGLVFRLPPKSPRGPQPYFLGDGPGYYPAEPDRVESVIPAPVALEGVPPALEDLRLAVRCRMRGWDELSTALYARARRLIEEFEVYQEYDDAPLYIIRDCGWLYWYGQLTEQHSDWRDVHRRLKGIYDRDERFRTEQRGDLLSKLEAALFHKRTARPGTPEALIDDLVDHWEDRDDPSNVSSQTAYWKLAELGFDAVPALLDHLNDTRLTRSFSFGFNIRSAHHVTVGHLCGRLINCLSARTADDRYWEARGDYLNNDKATVWLAEAKRIGEEKWLLDHVLPPGGGGGIVNHPRAPEKEIARALGAKYPARLPAVYRRALRGPIADRLEDFVPEIVASKLTRDAKADLLAEGAAHPDLKHRVRALRGLAEVDPARSKKHLRETIDAVRGDGDVVMPLEGFGPELVRLTVRAGDAGCWDALRAATKRVNAEGRLDVAVYVGCVAPVAPVEPNRRHRLRLGLQLLDDEDAEVRDTAATQLAGLLWLPVRRDPETNWVFHDQNTDPLTRFARRCVVGKLATDELARPLFGAERGR
jgi:hypothetical protein